ncbi:MAG: aspartyl protease family protein [Candidatus Cybelea sp.]
MAPSSSPGFRLCVFAMVAGALHACAAPPRFASTTITPQELLAHDRDAAGKCLAPGLYHFRYRSVSSSGDLGRSDAYEAAGATRLGDYHLISESHGLRVERGRLSGRSWARTANGLVLTDSILPTAFDRVRRAALHRPDSRVRVLGITTTTPHEYVLQIRPNARIDQEQYFDARTFLLRRIVAQNYDRAVEVQRYWGYVDVCGKPVPSHAELSSSLSPQTSDFSLVKHERLPYDQRLLAIPQSKTPFVPQHTLPATLNSMFGDSGILIRVDIEGTPYWFELDSGATDILIDRDLIRRLGGREFDKYTGSKGGPVEYSVAVLPRLDIGPVYSTNLVVTVLKHDYIAQGVHVVGMLGCDFLGSRPLAIDFRNQSVTLLNSAPSPADRRWTVVQTPLHSGVPSLDVRLEKQSATLVLDLGSPYTTINEDVFDKIGEKLTQLDETKLTFIGGVPLDATQYVVPRTSAGNLQLGPLIATVIAGGRGQDLQTDGILGRDVLKHYRLVLDYAHERTYFQRYATDEEP